MNQRNRVALLGAALLLVVLASAAIAGRLPRAEQAPDNVAASHEPQTADESPPSADALAHAADRLVVNGIGTDAEALVATLTDLSTRYGLGGAVRLVAWADETGLSVEELAAMRDEGQGWGQIAKELGVHPGIGSIMGNGGGHGRDGAPGQQRKADASPQP